MRARVTTDNRAWSPRAASSPVAHCRCTRERLGVGAAGRASSSQVLGREPPQAAAVRPSRRAGPPGGPARRRPTRRRPRDRRRQPRSAPTRRRHRVTATGPGASGRPRGAPAQGPTRRRGSPRRRTAFRAGCCGRSAREAGDVAVDGVELTPSAHPVEGCARGAVGLVDEPPTVWSATPASARPVTPCSRP